MVVNGNGNVGIGMTTPLAYLDITGTNNRTNSLQLRSGNDNSGTSSNQILFGWNSTAQYRHAIKTRHNASSSVGNSIDFYLWNQGTDPIDTIGTKAAVTIDGNDRGMIGIGTTTPKSEVHISDGSASLKTVNDAGGYGASMLITDNNIPRIYLEEAGQGTNQKLMDIHSIGQRISIGALTDPGSAWVGNQDLFTVTRAGNVGINTGAPTVLLDVEGGTTSPAFKLVDGTQGAGKLLVSDASGNATWQPASAAAGTTVSNTAGTNTISTTVNGVTGTPVTVPNIYTADGTLTANRTVTMGNDNITFASGFGNFYFSPVNGINAGGGGNVAMGDNVTASGGTSAVFGTSNNATGTGSFAFGWQNNATGTLSSALGGQQNTASGYGSMATGGSNTASGGWSLASGEFNTASGATSCAIGSSNTASGSQSLALGLNNTSSGVQSFTLGAGLQAPSQGEVVVGSFNTGYTPSSTTNWIGSDRLFTIGNGNPGFTSSNAVVVLKNGYVGIGTSSPSFVLDVVGRARMQAGGGSAGIWYTNAANTANNGFIGMEDDNHLGMFGNTGAGWGLTMNLTNGYVGIGTSGAVVPLEVDLATGSSPYSATAVNSTHFAAGATALTNSPATGLNGVNGVVAISAQGDIVGKGTITVASSVTYSDERIKDVIGQSDGIHDLDLLSRIKITDYTMKDKLWWGDKAFKKVIAQQVEQVYPLAVNKRTDFIPNIYAFASKVEKTDKGYLVTVDKTLPELKSDKIRLEVHGMGRVEATLVAVPGTNQMLLSTASDLTGKEVFVFGMEVNDFRTVDYEALSTLNISATQELARRCHQRKTEYHYGKIVAGAVQAWTLARAL
jgi:hypothetical protein